MLEGITKLTEAFDKEAEENGFVNVRLGVQLAGVINAHYSKDLIAYLKGESEGNGHLYFSELKPLYDEFGYEKVNKALLRLDKEKRENE